jgi:hypothetical protein
MAAIKSRTSPTGSDALSVKPAASEINFGRDNVNCINQEIGGAFVRRPSSDKAEFFIKRWEQ